MPGNPHNYFNMHDIYIPAANVALYEKRGFRVSRWDLDLGSTDGLNCRAGSADSRCWRGEPGYLNLLSRLLQSWVHNRCGCSSVVERHVANVNVEGSNPFTRFNRSPMDNRALVAFFMPYLSPHAKLVTPQPVDCPMPWRGLPCPAPDCYRAPRSSPVRSCAPKLCTDSASMRDKSR